MKRYNSKFFNKHIKYKYLLRLSWWIPLMWLLCILLVSTINFNYWDRPYAWNPILTYGIPGLKQFSFFQFLISLMLFVVLLSIKVGYAYTQHKQQKMVVAFDVNKNFSSIKLYIKDLFDNVDICEVRLDEIKITYSEREKDVVLNNEFNCYIFKKNNEVIGRFYINDYSWQASQIVEEFKRNISS